MKKSFLVISIYLSYSFGIHAADNKLQIPNEAEVAYSLGISQHEKGRKINLQQALRYFKLAADNGHAQAQFMLAQKYQNGEDVERDWNEAKRLYKLAADQGVIEALNKLEDSFVTRANMFRHLLD